jgi:hypothetical protein
MLEVMMKAKESRPKASKKPEGSQGIEGETPRPPGNKGVTRVKGDKKAPAQGIKPVDLGKPSDELDLKGEIRKLRSATNKLIEIAGDYQDINQATQVVQSIGLACTRMASLLKAQNKLISDTSNIDDVITSAIVDAAAELRRRETKQGAPG